MCVHVYVCVRECVCVWVYVYLKYVSNLYIYL